MSKEQDLSRFIKAYERIIVAERENEAAWRVFCCELRGCFAKGSAEKLIAGDDAFVGWCMSNLPDITTPDANVMRVAAIASEFFDSDDKVRLARGGSARSNRGNWAAIGAMLSMFSRADVVKICGHVLSAHVSIEHAKRDLGFVTVSAARSVSVVSRRMLSAAEERDLAEFVDREIKDKPAPTYIKRLVDRVMGRNEAERAQA